MSMQDDPHWYAVYTKARSEKKVGEIMEREGIEHYCPLKKEVKQWSDRKKLVYTPVFPSYVFVRCRPSERQEVLNIPGVMNYVFWLGKPAVIRNKEIEGIRLFLEKGSDLEVANLEVKSGELVNITSGAFKGFKGIVLEHNRQRVVLQIESLGIELRANIHKNKISVIK